MNEKKRTPGRVDYHDLGWIRAGKNRKRLLKLLKKDALTPTEAAKAARWSLNEASRGMKAMEARGIVEQANPGRRMGKIYKLTKKGRRLVAKL